MATNQTRQLVATREIQHGDKFVKPGDTFEASEVDAEHYLRKGHAKHASTAPAAPANAEAKAPAKAAEPAKKPATPNRAPYDAAKTKAFPGTADKRTVADVDREIKAENAKIPTPAGVTNTNWERTEPLVTKLEDVPHPDVGATPPKE